MPEPDEVEELARRLWDAFRGKAITRDRYGRPNYVTVRTLAWRLLETAEDAGVEDPLHEIDWIAILDPDLSPLENVRLFSTWVAQHVGKRVGVGDEVDKYATELERQLSWLKKQLEEAPPEAREGIQEEIRRVEEELESLRKTKRPERRKEKPPKKPAPKPPKPQPKPLKVAELPVEEARFRLERYVRGKVPRTYRFDWADLKARISHHREVSEELRKVIEEVGGRVVESRSARPPLVITVADFSDATAPPAAPLPPDFERYLLWSKFSAIIISRGADPSDYVEDFEAKLSEVEGKPLEEKQREIEKLAVAVAPPRRPITLPPDIVSTLEVLRSEIEDLKRAVAWRPKSSEDIRMLYEGLLLVEPKLMARIDKKGHLFWGPTDETMQTLASIVDRWALEYFLSCPKCRFFLPGGGLDPVDFVEHLINRERVVPPMAVEWLRKYARLLEEAEKGGPRG